MSRNPGEVFRTPANYMRAFAHLASDGEFEKARAYDRLLTRAQAANLLGRKPGQNCDSDLARRCLVNAWGTELLMVLGASMIGDDELVRLSDNWGAVQCYYVVYHATQAVAAARGFVRPDSHTKTQKMFADMWTQPSHDIAPWSLAACSGGVKNLPPTVPGDEGIHVWSFCTDLTRWGLACKALRTTREDLLRDAVGKKRDSKRTALKKAWKLQEADRQTARKKPRVEPRFPLPRLTVAEKVSVEASVRPVTVIDYLYRVRIRTNYEDSAMFTDGPTDPTASGVVRADLCMIAGTSLFLAELQVACLAGRRTFRQWTEEWVESKLPRGMQLGLGERAGVLAGFCM
jgi:hypothetical protein